MYDSRSVKCPEEANPPREKADEWLPGAGAKGAWEVTAHGHRVSFGDEENILELDGGGHACTALRIHQKPPKYTLETGEFCGMYIVPQLKN